MGDEPDDSVDLHKYLEFYCQPSNLKLQASQQGFLNILIKVNTNRLNNEVDPKDVSSRLVNKLLIGRLKDTNILFSFFLSINMIN
jgi:hypothetical protein